MRYIAPAIVILLALLFANGIYTVGQGHAAVLMRFDHVESTAIGPGLHFKLPFISQTRVYDTRTILQRSEPEDYKTADGDPVRVGYFVRWRIVDADAWFAATAGDELQVSQSMTPVIRDALRAQIGKHDLAELLGSDGGAIDRELRDAVSGDVRRKLGIDVLDIGVERVLPPDATLASVYKRMGAEAVAQAGAVRDEGQAAAAAIRAKGDAEDQKVLAAARQKAAALRGEGDAAAARIYAAAAAKDPQFFRYWSTLETWRKTFDDGGAVVVLDRNSPLMQALGDGASSGPDNRR